MNVVLGGGAFLEHGPTRKTETGMVPHAAVSFPLFSLVRDSDMSRRIMFGVVAVLVLATSKHASKRSKLSIIYCRCDKSDPPAHAIVLSDDFSVPHAGSPPRRLVGKYVGWRLQDLERSLCGGVLQLTDTASQRQR